MLHVFHRRLDTRPAGDGGVAALRRAPVRNDAVVTNGKRQGSARDVVTHPKHVTVIALAVGGVGIVAVWRQLGLGWAAATAAAVVLGAAVAYRLTPLQTYEFRDGVLHYRAGRRYEEWAIATFVTADMTIASRGADSLVLRRRDGRELLVPVTAQRTLATAAPELFQQGVAMSPTARRFLEAMVRDGRS